MCHAVWHNGTQHSRPGELDGQMCCQGWGLCLVRKPTMAANGKKLVAFSKLDLFALSDRVLRSQ